MSDTAATDAMRVESSVFIRELLKQLRAQDWSGALDKKTDAELLAPYVVTREQRRKMPIIADPDARTLLRIELFYNAVGMAIEKRTDVIASPMLKLHHEGFGRLVMIAGRLVVLSRTLRDVHRFGFESLETLADEGEKLVESGIEMINAFPEVVNYNS